MLTASNLNRNLALSTHRTICLGYDRNTAALYLDSDDNPPVLLAVNIESRYAALRFYKSLLLFNRWTKRTGTEVCGVQEAGWIAWPYTTLELHSPPCSQHEDSDWIHSSYMFHAIPKDVMHMKYVIDPSFRLHMLVLFSRPPLHDRLHIGLP